MSQASQKFRICVLIVLICIVGVSCTTSGPSGLFGKKSPHEEYGDKIKNAGLQETALGQRWFAAADKSLNAPLSVNIPYSEAGYFPADDPIAVGLIFNGKRGEKLTIDVSKKPVGGFSVYLDLWQYTIGEKPAFLIAADTIGSALVYEVDKDGKYILRLQPELLKGGEYNLSIIAGPSLAFPVTPKVKSNIGSFWGAGRDAGARSHEGIDIFAPRNTALIAAADGLVTRVNENKLGGKVVFLTPAAKDYTLYYAHLDQQLVQPGQVVKTGDTIGLMGNTGNAITTSPHLHFGVYTNNGAVDPLPFVNRITKSPEKISAPMSNVNHWVRNNKAIRLSDVSDETGTNSLLEINTLLKVEAATAGWYKVSTPGGESGFISSTIVSPVSSPLRRANLKTALPLLDAPSDSAAKKATLVQGQPIKILAAYHGFYFVSKADTLSGWISKEAL